jgi:hypothetical protein
VWPVSYTYTSKVEVTKKHGVIAGLGEMRAFFSGNSRASCYPRNFLLSQQAFRKCTLSTLCSALTTLALPTSNLLFSRAFKAGRRRSTNFHGPPDITVFLRAPSLRGGFCFTSLCEATAKELRQGVFDYFSESPLHLSRRRERANCSDK